MKSNIWPLLRIQWIATWRGSLERMTGTKSKLGLLLFPLILIGFLPMTYLFWTMYKGVYLISAAAGQGQATLSLTLTVGQLACLFFGVFYVISTFYYSKDMSILVPLPLRPSEIVISKFIGIVAGEYVTMAPVVLPGLLVYGQMADVGPLYIPFAILAYLLLPILPLVVASLFSIVLMKVTNLRRNRDLFRVFGGLVGVVIALGFQFVGRLGAGNANSQEALEQMLASGQPVLDALSRYIPTSLLATNALREGAAGLGLVPFLLFLAVEAVAVALLIWTAERLFFGGLLGGDESRSSGKRLTQAELAQQTGRVQSPLKALLLREIRLLNRTPSFLMAGILPPLLMPIFIFLPLSQAGGPLQGSSDLSEVAHSPWVPVFALAALLFLSSMSNIPATAISREGRHFWISRSLPVAPHLQVHAKLLHSLLFASLNLLVVLGALFFLRLATPTNLIVVLIGGLLVGVVVGYSGLLIDVLRPSLNWTDPQQAMKGNMNGLFSMGVNLVLTLVTGGVIWLLALVAPSLLPFGLLLTLFLEGYALSRATGALADRRYSEYEF